MNHRHALVALVLASPAVAQAQYTLHEDVPVIVTETLNEELYNLAVPISPPSPMPLIVAFHGLGQPNHDLILNASRGPSGWDLLTDATALGFGVLMPRGGNPADFPPYEPLNVAVHTYGRRIMHYHVAAAIADMQSRFNIVLDSKRIYGYGFSMGGDDVLSYAARHLDPTSIMFAAVLTHSGAVSPPYFYDTHPGQNYQDLYEGYYGVTTNYASEELKFQEATAVDYYQSALRPDTSMAWNLTHMPVFNYYGNVPGENADVRPQCVQLDVLMANHVLHPHYTTGSLTTNGHDYPCLSTSTILGAFTGELQLPTKAKTLVAQPLSGTNERVFHFLVTRRVASTPLMASFDWDLHWVPGPFKPYPPTLDLHNVKRLKTIRGFTAMLGYSAAQWLNIDVTIADGRPVRVEMTDYAAVTQILGNGVPLTAGVDYGIDPGSILWINVPVDMLLEIHR